MSATGADRPRLGDLAVGQEVAAAVVRVTRADLVRYAGASGDLNPIHWDERTALAVGLPGVIAHGMLTMGVAARLVGEWAGDPAAVLDVGVRFTGQVVVDATDGADLELSAVVAVLDAAAGTARVDVTATSAGARVLGRARAVVALPA